MRFKGQTLVVLMNCHEERFHIWEITKALRNVRRVRHNQMTLTSSFAKSEHQTARGERCLCDRLSLPLMVGFVVARLSHLMLGRFLLPRQHVINNRAQVMDLNGPRLCMIDPSGQRNVFEVEVGALRCG